METKNIITVADNAKANFWHMPNRGSLVDILSQFLTGDETVYTKVEADGQAEPKFNPRRIGLYIENEDISISYGDEDNRPSISVRVAGKALADEVVALADRYDKLTSTKPIKYYGDKDTQITIYLDDEDFEGNYEEEGILVRPCKAKGRKKKSNN